MILLLDGGLQGLLVWLLRKAYYEKHLEWPMTLIGSVAFVLLISGYIPIPFELMKRRGRVVGIDFFFLAIDWFGAFFSLMSLGMIIFFSSRIDGVILFLMLSMFQQRKIPLIPYLERYMRYARSSRCPCSYHMAYGSSEHGICAGSVRRLGRILIRIQKEWHGKTTGSNSLGDALFGILKSTSKQVRYRILAKL